MGQLDAISAYRKVKHALYRARYGSIGLTILPSALNVDHQSLMTQLPTFFLSDAALTGRRQGRLDLFCDCHRCIILQAVIPTCCQWISRSRGPDVGDSDVVRIGTLHLMIL